MIARRHLWEPGLRTLRILQRDARLARLDQRWKSLLAAVHRLLRKEARKNGYGLVAKSPVPTEPVFLGTCLGILRRLAGNAENRRLAVTHSRLPQTVRAVRREIRLDLRSEPRRKGWADVPPEEKQAALELLQAVKDDPGAVSEAERAELWECVNGIRHKALQFARRSRAATHTLSTLELKNCEAWLPKLTAESYPDWDFHEFKGLLAKVHKAFEKDRKQGRSSVEERRVASTEDAGSSPAGPDLNRIARRVALRAPLHKTPLSWWTRFKRWLTR